MGELHPKSKLWLDQGMDDLKGAQADHRTGRFYSAIFWCHQAVEKALKALFIEEIRDLTPKTHSLILLAEETSLPKIFHRFLKDLGPKYVETRYPDVIGDLPSHFYDAEMSGETLAKTEEVVQWIADRLSKG
jgi:HEPN domain-containing protein